MYPPKTSFRETLARSALKLLGAAGMGLVILGSLLLAPLIVTAAWLSRYLLERKMDEMGIVA